jgi:hypothetical protein
MALLPPLKLTEQEKLEALQRLDRFRKWRSLDDKRYCLVCSTIITGREIQIIGGTRGAGPLRVICPSDGCHSIPMDWVLPTDEVLAKIAGGRAAAAPNDQRGWRKNLVVSRFRRFATHFKRPG